MRTLPDHELDRLGDRFLELGLRARGITFEQYLAAPSWYERHYKSEPNRPLLAGQRKVQRGQLRTRGDRPAPRFARTAP